MNTAENTPSMAKNLALATATTLDTINLREIVVTAIKEKWLLLGCMLTIGILTTGYLMSKPPQYQAEILLQIQNNQSGLGGNLTQDIHYLLNDKESTKISPTEVQKALIASRFILQPVIQKLHLNIKVKPHYMPFLSAFFADKKATHLKKPFFNLNRYAWGGEQLTITKLSIPTGQNEKPLKLVAGKTGQYQLFNSDGKLLLEGSIGQLVQTATTDKSAKITIKIDKLLANPGTEFYISKTMPAQAEATLAKSIYIQDIGVSRINGNNTGLLRVIAKYHDPQKVIDILNAIARISVKTDIKFKSENIEKMSNFLETQFYNTKSDLEKAEAKLSQYQAKNKKRTTINDSIEASLKRDIEIKSQLNRLILTKQDELRLVKAGIVSNTRVLTFAQYSQPIRTNIVLSLSAALCFGLFLGIGIAFIRKSFKQYIEDPFWLEQNAGIPNLAIIAHSVEQVKNSRSFKKRTTDHLKILAKTSPRDISVESLRSLRTNLQFILPQVRNNIIAIMGISEGVGKSFISVNFAYLLADSKRVLLIDGDIRKGHLHNYFNQSQQATPGLTGILNGTVTLEKAIIKTKYPNLDFLPNGKYPANPAELLMTDQLDEFLAKASREYDLVLIDTPPALAATDSILLAKQAGINFLIIGAAQHRKQAIELVLKQLHNNGITLNGSIYNNIRAQSHTYNTYYYNYAYSYHANNNNLA